MKYEDIYLPSVIKTFSQKKKKKSVIKTIYFLFFVNQTSKSARASEKVVQLIWQRGSTVWPPFAFASSQILLLHSFHVRLRRQTVGTQQATTRTISDAQNKIK